MSTLYFETGSPGKGSQPGGYDVRLVNVVGGFATASEIGGNGVGQANGQGYICSVGGAVSPRILARPRRGAAPPDRARPISARRCLIRCGRRDRPVRILNQMPATNGPHAHRDAVAPHSRDE